ncbi:MAG TPA: PIG-L family deacetylase [Anaerolineales bacterium]|nr:PIG-L family deacetylase [Anaerolineales bacterium]
MHVYGRKLLFLGAHPDDIELGCGALLSNLGKKADVLCVTLSDNQQNPALRNLVDEHYRSMALLGIERDQIVLGPFETRHFPRDRQEILEFLFDINRSYQPEIVFVHTESDIHQDHSVATVEALRAFRGTTVLGFDVLRSSYGFFPNFLVEVTEEDVEKKVRCLLEYGTYCDKYYFSEEVIRSTLIRHGALAERPYAEGFDILRIIGTFQAP